TIVKNTPVTFTAENQNGDSYHWKNESVHVDHNTLPTGKTYTYTWDEEGFYDITLAVVNSDGDMIGVKTKEFEVINSPRPPQNVQLQTNIENRSFIKIEYANKLTWEKNPDNELIGEIEHYKVYKREKGMEEWGSEFKTLQPGTFELYERGFISEADAAKYEYAVSVKVVGIDVESELAVHTNSIGSSLKIK
ncbi:hypothetical protein C5S42_00195, partial [Candidatus Methanomarinus sp.]